MADQKISQLTTKATPVSNDTTVIVDSAAPTTNKKINLASFPISTAVQNALDAKLESSDITDFETTTELNARDTANRDRTNHTGTQAISTVSGLQSDLDSKIAKDVNTTYTTNAITTLTQAEYDAIGTKDANTLYFIV